MEPFRTGEHRMEVAQQRSDAQMGRTSISAVPGSAPIGGVRIRLPTPDLAMGSLLAAQGKIKNGL
jgi:hypothetical protein